MCVRDIHHSDIRSTRHRKAMHAYAYDGASGCEKWTPALPLLRCMMLTIWNLRGDETIDNVYVAEYVDNMKEL